MVSNGIADGIQTIHRYTHAFLEILSKFALESSKSGALSERLSVSAVRKSTSNSRHRKPPLRGGTMRYRADITKQSRVASVLHFCNTRATCCVRLVHAKLQPSDAVGMRIAAAVADQHLQVAGETDEQPRTIAANSNKTALICASSFVSFMFSLISLLWSGGRWTRPRGQCHRATSPRDVRC